MTEKTESFDAVIVGAGFAGLHMLYKCREIGLRAHLFEAGAGVGGTWYWNRYPGARCDTESIMYSYSFDPELEQEWSWSERYAAQPEIRAYLDHVADRYDLRRDIDLETRIVSAHFHDARKRWRVTTADGRSADCQFFITAVGCLSIAKAPEWPGQSEFRGRVIHTSSWPEEEPDLTGKRVGVVGTGSSAIQAIPLIAERARELIVFQRTASFSLPARNAPTDPEDERSVKASYEDLRERARTSPIGNFWSMPTKSALEVSAEEREETFEDFWQAGSSRFILAFTDLTRNLEANEFAADFVRRKIAAAVRDPETARKLTPHGYPIATKRLCLDTGYYDTYNRPNVQLVDVSADPIVSLTPTGLRTEHASWDFDVLVFATGFDAVTGAFNAIDIRGKGGAELREHWRDGPRTYLGLASAGFPNMFMITGPLSPSALSIVTVSIEQHVDWIGDAIVYLRDHDFSIMETEETCEAEWDREVDAAESRTLHHLAQFTYYWGGNIPGKPRKFLQYAGGVGPYRAICDAVVKDGYRGFALS
jgi:cation diffusion facilitator CzcD-associated flavoprotein CzcO